MHIYKYVRDARQSNLFHVAVTFPDQQSDGLMIHLWVEGKEYKISKDGLTHDGNILEHFNGIINGMILETLGNWITLEAPGWG